jgi:hypothetical protein
MYVISNRAIEKRIEEPKEGFLIKEQLLNYSIY